MVGRVVVVAVGREVDTVLEAVVFEWRSGKGQDTVENREAAAGGVGGVGVQDFTGARSTGPN